MSRNGQPCTRVESICVITAMILNGVNVPITPIALVPSYWWAVMNAITSDHARIAEGEEAEMLDILALTAGLILLGLVLVLGAVVFGLAAIWATMRSSQISRLEERKR